MKKIIAVILSAVTAFGIFATACFAQSGTALKKYADIYADGGSNDGVKTSFRANDSNKQSNVFDDTFVKNGGQSIKFSFKDALEGREAYISLKENIDVSAIEKSGYLCFDMYVSTEIEDEIYPDISLVEKNGSGSRTASVSLNNIVYNEWNEVKIKLSDFENPIDYADFYRIVLSLPNQLTQDYDVYLQSVAFYDAPVLKITEAFCESGIIGISWDYESEVSQYEIYADGEVIGSVDGEKRSFRTEYSDMDATIMLKVKALDESEETLAESEQIKCVVTDKYLKEVKSLYANQGYSNGIMDPYIDKVDGNTGFSKNYSDTSPLGGYSAYFNLKNLDAEKQLQLNGKATDVTELYDEGFLRFYIYIDTELTDYHNIKASFRDSAGAWQESSQVELPLELKYNKWQIVKLRINQFKNQKFDFSKLFRLELKKFDKVTEKFDIYVQGVGFCTTLSDSDVSVKSSGINQDGNSFVTLEFSENMSYDSFVPENFSIDGMTCIGAERDEFDYKIATLTFDTMFEFPQTYTITFGENVLSEDGLPLMTNSTKFTTASVHNSAAVLNVSYDKTGISEGILGCNADVNVIYTENGEAQDIAMLAVAYENQKIIGVAYDLKTDAAVKTVQNFSCTINTGTVLNVSDCRIEVYFVNNLAEGRPLCEKQIIYMKG